MSTHILLYLVLLPLAAGVLGLLVPRAVKWFREILALIVTAAVFAGSLWLFFGGAEDVSITLVEIGAITLSLDLVLTKLSAVILVFASGFSFVVCLYSLAEQRDAAGAKPFFSFLLMTTSCSSR